MAAKKYCVLCVVVVWISCCIVEGKDSIDENGGLEQARNRSCIQCVSSLYLPRNFRRSDILEAFQHDFPRQYICIWLSVVMCISTVVLLCWHKARSMRLKRYQEEHRWKTSCKPSSEEVTSVNVRHLLPPNDSGNEKSDKACHNRILESHDRIESPAPDETCAVLPASTQSPQQQFDGSLTAYENDIITVKKMIEDIQELRERMGCKICLNACMNIVFLPCNHMVACENCSMFLDNCPVCRCRVKGTLQVQTSI